VDDVSGRKKLELQARKGQKIEALVFIDNSEISVISPSEKGTGTLLLPQTHSKLPGKQIPLVTLSNSSRGVTEQHALILDMYGRKFFL
jgi:hypothetical protein